jgi:UDP-N-acetylmuramoylalanine--D-glutamate ligase
MRNKDYFRDKKITVVGLARSGLACANLLYELGGHVSITDNRDCDATRLNISRLKSKEIRVELGRHSEGFIAARDFVVISPGVPQSALPILWARQRNIPVISEVEVAWILCPATIIAASGSNGKTTVTTLIGKILEEKRYKVFTCGNIGNPFTGEVEKMGQDDFVSLEISSFQLENIQKFKPKIALILNIAVNHLDRYKNMQEYIDAKKRIFLNQDGNDYLVLNGQDPELRKLAREAKSSVSYFEQTPDLNPNQAAVCAIGKILGINQDICRKVFLEFKGIQHRLEFVERINEVTFINDSKATTVDSAIWALSNINQPIILIAGGRHKGVDYRAILDLARKKVKEVILIGEAKELMEEAWGGYLSIHKAESLRDAIKTAFTKASPGDCVLLSPMCSSYDMFLDYEERGSAFKEAVYALAEKHKP